MRDVLPLCLVGILSVSCGDNSELVNSDHEESPPIGMIRTGDYTIILHSADGGPRYSIRNQDDEIIDSLLNSEQMARRHPDLYREMKGLWAGNGQTEAPSTFEQRLQNSKYR
ncbi:MAG: hypothetical protein AAGA96_01815 [Verrucomicrobiota bacterium]